LKILHVTTGLENGGAENLLARLVGRMDPSSFENVVVSLTDEGADLGARIRHEGVPLHCLGFRRGIPDPRMLLAVARCIDRERPDIVQTWMYHADMAGALAQPFTRHRIPLIWGLHNVALDVARSKTQTVGVTRLNARLSRRFPDRIVCCSEAVREDHVAMGYAPEKMRVIPNGIDTEEFVPDPPARVRLRRELGLAPETPLIGLIARFDPQKDHLTFFRAAGLLHKILPEAHFVLCGREITPENTKLTEWAAENGVEGVTHLLGLRRDTAQVTAALDVATCCSSFGESFALVLGEAMACGVPVVTTDMAGPVSLVGDLGRIVSIRDAAALAETWHELLTLSSTEREAWGRKARGRITDEFSLTRMVQGYEALYRERYRFGAAAPEGEMACH
jgi:glycosyltransferase involved in cell wall biosynthesis